MDRSKEITRNDFPSEFDKNISDTVQLLSKQVISDMISERPSANAISNDKVCRLLLDECKTFLHIIGNPSAISETSVLAGGVVEKCWPAKDLNPTRMLGAGTFGHVYLCE